MSHSETPHGMEMGDPVHLGDPGAPCGADGGVPETLMQSDDVESLNPLARVDCLVYRELS